MPSHATAADHIQDLGTYVSASPSSFHAVHEAGRRLDGAGFTSLDELQPWELANIWLQKVRPAGHPREHGHLVLFGSDIDVRSLVPWLVAVALLGVGGLWLRVEARAFARVWDNLTADLKQRGL